MPMMFLVTMTSMPFRTRNNSMTKVSSMLPGIVVHFRE